MKKYKYVGSDKEMIENGFLYSSQYPYDVDGIKAVKRTEKGNIFIDMDNRIMSFNEELIKDLVTKGLAKEIEEEVIK